MKRVLTLMILLATVVSVSAAETKIGFVNMKTLFSKFYKTKDLNSALITKREIIKKRGKRLQDELMQLNAEFKQMNEDGLNPALSPDARKKLNENAKMKRTSVLMKDKEIRDFVTSKGKEMQKEYEASRDDVVAEIQKEVSSFAKKVRYDMIVDVSGESANMVPVIMYYNKNKDVTAIILRRLNAGHEVVEKKDK